MFINQISRKFCSTANTMSYLSADNITSAASRENLMQLLAMIPKYKVKYKSDKKASVLIPLCQHDNGEISLLYTLRSANLSSHPGHVAFPGGKVDSTDKSYVDTALRETEEELGISRDCVEVWGEFSNLLPGKNYDIAVMPIIGLIRDFDRLKLNPNPSEVEEVFTISLEKLCDRSCFGFNQFKNGYIVPVFMGGPHKIWGLTALITHIFLSCLLPEAAYPQRFQHVSVPDRKSKL